MRIPELNQISKLYHGTYRKFDMPSLDFSQPFRDFGRGFYTTTDFSQAQDFAMIKSRRNASQGAYVLEYDFNLGNSLSAGLSVKRFAVPDIDWIDFIIANRELDTNKSADVAPPLSYDIVIGPVADMAAGPIIENLVQGIYGNLLSEGHRAKTFAIGLLDADRLENQVVFCSKKALGLLGRTIAAHDVTACG